MRLLTVAILNTCCLAAFATASLETLTYRSFQHEASNRLFLAKVELGAAHSNVVRARYVHDKNIKLREREAIAEFEFIDSLMKVMETTFAEKRAAFHVTEWELREKIWEANLHRRAGAARSVADNYRKIANARLEVFQHLNEALKPYIKELNKEFEGSKRLAETRALSDADFHKITVLRDDYLGLQALAASELEKAQAQVVTTEVDLSGTTP